MPRLAWIVSANLTTAKTDETTFSGGSFAGAVGYRYGWTSAVGVHVSAGRFTSDEATSALVPVNALAMWHLHGKGRAWGDVLFGMHAERREGDWHTAPLLAVQGGLDLVGGLGVALRWETTVASSLDYTTLSLGLAFRR
jgi:hypothetical protein